MSHTTYQLSSHMVDGLFRHRRSWAGPVHFRAVCVPTASAMQCCTARFYAVHHTDIARKRPRRIMSLGHEELCNEI